MTLLKPKLSKTLISEQNFLDLLSCAADIPGQATAFFGFECPLQADCNAADLLFCSTQEEGHVRVLAGNHDSVCVPGSAMGLSAWQAVSAFCRHWEEKGSPLHGSLLNSWLEFDVGGSAPPWSPSFFFGTLPPDVCSRSERVDTIKYALTCLAGESVQGTRGEMLDRVISALPEPAYIFQVGLMLSRNVEAVRICIRGLAADQILPLLGRVGWQGDKKGLQLLINRYHSDCEGIDLDLDIGSSIGPKIGLEFSFGRDQQTVQRMQSFTQRCVSDGLTSAAKAAALLAYNGYIQQSEGSASHWPEYLIKKANEAGPGACNILLLWIHHIKLVWDKNSELSAKAYLAVLPEILKERISDPSHLT